MNAQQPANIKQHILRTAQQIVSAKGYSAVGLNEVLSAAGVPKGSFYHYFGSKDAFGVALLEDYFDRYLTDMAQLFSLPSCSERDTLLRYFQQWLDNQCGHDHAGKCLAVKLGAEVADLSEPMRQALQAGTARIIDCLARSLTRGQAHATFTLDAPPQSVALRLYALWLGASVMAKITRNSEPFVEVMALTRQVLVA